VLEDGTRLGYDLLSLDVGSGVVPPPLPPGDGVFPARPLESILDLARALDEAPAGVRVAVVGGGPSGVELALTAHARLRRRGLEFRIVLLEARDRLLPDDTAAVGALARGILDARGIEVRTGSRVTAARPGALRDAAGREEPFDLLVWAAGPAPAELNARSGLELDAEGWLLVEPSLRAVGRRDVFAAGDAVTLREGPRLPKAGVYAVREGPVLWRSLRAALGGRPLPAYRPQRCAMWILNAGDGTALLVWGPLRSHSRWARRLKERIDRRFIRRYLARPR
jgi:NADH dehydrogenase FAD-containing subunit